MKQLTLIASAILFSAGVTAQSCENNAQLVAIHDVQGAAESSPMEGKQATVSGIVTANWSNKNQLSGFFIQSPTDHVDDDPLTSQGLFVATQNISHKAEVGTQVRVTGTVSEINGLTQLTNPSAIYDCGPAEQQPSTITVSLPFDSRAQAEALEGMQVIVEGDEPLTISGHYQFPRHGYFDVSAGRLWTPTQVAKPGSAANARRASNRLNRLQVDDNSNQQPDVLPHQSLFHGPQNSLRSGARLKPISGILSQYNDIYRLQPTVDLQLAERSKITPIYPKRTEHLRVASFNVLNYFNGDGKGGGFPTERGAHSPEQLKRQQQKIIAALVALDADVLGLMEVENDGFSQYSAITQLTKALNQAQSKTYAIAQPRSERVGSDQISVAIIYNSERLTPGSHAKTLVQGPFTWGSRVPLAQVFVDKNNDKTFTAVVNHFKSKGSCPDSGSNANQHDGQACWNSLRLESAESLLSWVANEQFPAPVLLGDFNAYYHEDPIQYMTSNGYKNVSSEHDYSYVYDSQAGALDHILVADELVPSIDLVQHINFNADEPGFYDYRDKTYYQPGPYRSSDHDPLVVDFDWRESGK
ncbi:ExeM/NucH family extracellular endonuclease [Idiomarina seosinensis]|uniref:Nuclease n=1 Tax=Idiomarina seosinensis TaxID=281739 RepID=A0A432ZJ06_9GAMM|nr:ExeM/NucH family extracellular endonuclease [Idiomarina seosinensis]RUO77810.1 nuclease [Idiomarina seosinensis]